MDQEIELIWGSDQITEWFGYWPTFHDAAVHLIKLQQKVPAQAGGATVELLIHTWEPTNEKDGRGCLIRRKQCLVHLRLEDCTEVRLEGFRYQNVLLGLDFEVSGSGKHRKLRVVLNPSTGVQGNFTCDHVEVFGVIPCDNAGVPIDG